jgi:hypothetical protein
VGIIEDVPLEMVKEVLRGMGAGGE